MHTYICLFTYLLIARLFTVSNAFSVSPTPRDMFSSWPREPSFGHLDKAGVLHYQIMYHHYNSMVYCNYYRYNISYSVLRYSILQGMLWQLPPFCALQARPASVQAAFTPCRWTVCILQPKTTDEASFRCSVSENRLPRWLKRRHFRLDCQMQRYGTGRQYLSVQR